MPSIPRDPERRSALTGKTILRNGGQWKGILSGPKKHRLPDFSTGEVSAAGDRQPYGVSDSCAFAITLAKRIMLSSRGGGWIDNT